MDKGFAVCVKIYLICNICVYFYIINLSKENHNLKQISKKEMQWLIANKFLKMEGEVYKPYYYWSKIKVNVRKDMSLIISIVNCNI